MRTDVTVRRARPADPASLGLVASGAVLRAAADPMRAAILELLAGEQLCTCHLQEALGAKQNLVSHHLRLLREMGLVLTEAHGRFTYYRLAPDAFAGARDALASLAGAAASAPRQRPC